MTSELATFLFACVAVLVALWVATAITLIAWVVVKTLRDVVHHRRTERRLRTLAAQARADVRARRQQRPSGTDTDDPLSFEGWPVLPDEPPIVFPRRRTA